MKVVKVQFASWDKAYYFTDNNIKLETGDKVIVKTEIGTELGNVAGFENVDDGIYKPVPGDDSSDKEKEEDIENRMKYVKPIQRKATQSEIDKLVSNEEKEKAVSFCVLAKERFELPMKVFDVHFSYDGSRITFAFIADGRVDFRDLVKELTRHFGRTIRLQQVGIRDEARESGDCGHCGKPLCCKKVLKNLESITSEMTELQQCSHRGSDRVSGLCGRLMCCLGYEQKGYEDLISKMPAIGAKVNVDGKRGVVMGRHVLKQSVNVQFEDEKTGERSVVEIDLNRNKKK